MRSHDDKKFKPEQKPFKENKLCSIYRATDQSNEKFYAKFFLQRKLIDLNIFQSTDYNQTVLSDLSDEMFPEHFLEIKYTYSIPQGFIFVTEPYEYTLETFLKTKVIEEKEAMKIFQQLVKSVYSLYMAGFWHRNVRPEHFVKVRGIWKMESIVFNECYKDANGLETQFLWNPSYQPPQAYEKEDFSEEQLDQMVVWNLGSILVDILLSHHKLKDKTILDKYKERPFSFKAIGVKKQFSEELNELLGKMLHYNRSQRMTIQELFSNEFVSREVARIHKKGETRKNKIYVAGTSALSKSLSQSSERAQEILTVKDFKKDKDNLEMSIHQSVIKKNNKKLETKNQMLQKIKILTEQDRNSYQNEQSENIALRNSRMKDLMSNHSQKQAIQAYKCYYDKCQLLLISSEKLEEIKGIISRQTLLLNKFAVTFVALNTLYRLAQSMNRNLNYLNLEPQIWSDFQQSKQFRGFKEIMNYRRTQSHNLLAPLRQDIMNLSQYDKDLIKLKEIQQLVQCNYKNTRFPIIKAPYRKILKKSYDTISKVYNSQKSEQLARMGMYVTYCMTIDKMYIPTDIPDNFQTYFQWMRLPSSAYVSMDNFQQYLDNADKRTLISHSIYILKKYFNKGSQDQY